MDETFDICTPMRIIFCRNVMIYFERQTQERLLNKFCRCLLPGGFLFSATRKRSTVSTYR